MPDKKILVNVKSNINDQELKKKITSALGSCDGFIFVSIEGNKLNTAYGLQDINGEQVIVLSKALRSESTKLLLMVEDAVEKHFGTKPKGVS